MKSGAELRIICVPKTNTADILDIFNYMGGKAFELNYSHKSISGVEFAGKICNMWASIYIELLTIFRNFIYSKNLKDRKGN
jgi:hypothetical protein